ncbi:UDP-N-acetylglucosamine 1-carboxyvinyltransferase, partial [bacterium]
MAKFVIQGGNKLTGEVQIGGFKNSALPLLAATLLTDEECTLTNVPDILDVRNFLEIMRGLGSQFEFENHTVKIRTLNLNTSCPDDALSKSMRASVLFLGALLGRAGEVCMPIPGGDAIGSRPIDVHLRGFEYLGAAVDTGGKLTVKGQKLKGRKLFAESSVTGTENLVLAAVGAEGTTTIALAAEEPHVTALCEFLNKMGASISGVGTHSLKIVGVKKLGGASFEVIPD